MRDLEVVAEGPVDEALALDRLQRAGEQARGDPRDYPLHAQHPAERERVLSRERVVAGQRLFAGPVAVDDAAQLAPACDAEVQSGADALGGQRQAMARGVADEEHAVL